MGRAEEQTRPAPGPLESEKHQEGESQPPEHGYLLSCEENTPQDLVEQAQLLPQPRPFAQLSELVPEHLVTADQVLPRLRGA